MKRGYCVEIDWNSPEVEGMSSGVCNSSDRHRQFRSEVEQFVEEFSTLGSSGVFDANKLISQWFPIVKADVFLSHSHDSKGMVELFYDFIAERGDKGRFKVDSLLKASEHVHCMLERSILAMMDKCDDFVFLDESSSVSNVTLSPWIYSELEFSKHLLGSEGLIKEGVENFSVQVAYNKSLKHLSKVTLDGLCRQLRGNSLWRY